jgi:hypothetical protein
LGALALLALVTGAWTTNKHSATIQRLHHVTGTGPIVGTGMPLGKGIRFISIAEVVAGTDESLIVLFSNSLASSPDTLVVGASGWEGEFPNGLDSANVIVLAAGVEFGVHTSN